MRTRMHHFLVLPLLVVAFLLGGCGAEGDPGPGTGNSTGDASAGAETSPETRISDEALGSLERENLELQLAWTVGVVNRDPTEGAGDATLRSAAVERVDGADRLLLTFDAGGGVPGYRVQGSIDPPTDCETGEEIALAGQGVLLVRLRDTTSGDELEPPTSVGDVLRNVAEVRLTCTRNGAMEWALPVGTATYYRVLEASTPPRLAIDIRHPEAESEAGNEESEAP